MESFTLDTPGKVNLFLRVGDRRPDGYHEIETLFFPVQTVADTVSMRFPDGGEIHIRCSDPAVPADESNLCWKAADLYRKYAGIASGVEISIVKHIPTAAGMGGGSSDAAAVLRLMQRRFRALDADKLADIAVKIGADVPFFLRSVPAVGRGVGERLEAVDGVPSSLPLLIAAPLFPVSAAWSYRHLDRTAAEADLRTMDPLLDALRRSDFQNAASLLRNDLEHAVLDKFPLLAILKREFIAEGSRVMVSGSGPTLFVFYESFAARERAVKHARALAEQYAFALLKP